MKLKVIFVIIFLFLIPFISLAGGICKKEKFTIAIDTGHSLEKPGAISSTGRVEYEYNKNITNQLFKELTSQNYFVYQVINSISLLERTNMVNKEGADILLVIHHDSVQPKYFKKYLYNGKEMFYSNNFTGYSIFFSGKNKFQDKSLKFANFLGIRMIENGFIPTLHHAEKIPGEGRDLVDKYYGIYKYNDLILLKNSKVPSILLECGIIVNAEEEAKLMDPSYQNKIINSIIKSIEDYCIYQQKFNSDR